MVNNAKMSQAPNHWNGPSHRLYGASSTWNRTSDPLTRRTGNSAALSTSLNRRPIHRLPTELLLKIFQLSVELVQHALFPHLFPSWFDCVKCRFIISQLGSRVVLLWMSAVLEGR